MGYLVALVRRCAPAGLCPGPQIRIVSANPRLDGRGPPRPSALRVPPRAAARRESTTWPATTECRSRTERPTGWPVTTECPSRTTHGLASHDRVSVANHPRAGQSRPSVRREPGDPRADQPRPSVVTIRVTHDVCHE